MKKLTVVLVTLMLCLQVFSGTAVYGAVGDNILIKGYETGETSIREGDTFTLELSVQNQNGTDVSKNITNLNVDVGLSSDFYGDPSYTNIFTNEQVPADNGIHQIVSKLELGYKGTGNTLVLIFRYTIDGTAAEETHTLYISEAKPDDGKDDTPSTPVDTSKYVPKLSSASTSRIPVIAAGSPYKLKYTVKNTTGHQAKNVDVSLKMVDETKAPLVFDNFVLNQAVESINSNSSKDITFDINILKTSPEGIFALKLNYEFDNAFGDHFSTSETVYIKIENNNSTPKLIVDNVSLKENAVASGAVMLELKIKNLGTLAAEDVKVTLGGLKSGGFTTFNSTDVKFAGNISGNGSKTVSYQLLMPTSGAAGSNELSAKIEYEDAAGTKYTETNQIFVPAGEGEDTKPDISFEKIVSPQAALSANDDFSISLDLKNNGGATAKNIKVSLTTEAGIITKSMNPVYVSSLDAKAAKNISFKLFAADDAATKNYPVALNVEYEDIFGVKYNATQYVGVFVENETGKTVPRIIIDNYSMDPFPVNAGDDFNLKMSFLNTSKTVDVSNIKVTVSSADGVFTPTDTGNTFFLEGIPSKQNVERELLLHVKPDAEQKSYMLTVDFEYEDDKGNPYTAKETMSVRVLQSPRLVTGQLNLMTDTFVGQPVSIYLDFYNMGKSILYNLMVSVEGDFQGQNLSYYVGNFESGRTDFFDVAITPMSAGTQTGSVLFSFEDANGKPVEVRKEFTLNVTEMMQEGPMLDENGMPINPDMGMPGMDGMPGGAPKVSLLVYIIIGVVVLGIGAVVFIILRKRHVRRKEMSLDE